VKKRAVVFAGQGAQAVGMGRDLAEQYPECRALFEKADGVLGYSLSGICFDGPMEELTRADRCQPAVFTVSMACYAALMKEAPGISFAGAAGLSLGEWTALCAAGAVSFEQALEILAARGRFMQEACDERPGGMVSVIGLSLETARQVAASAGVEVANINSPEQVVLSGEKSRIPAAENAAKQGGASRTVVLNVAGAFHSSLMGSAARKLEEKLRSVSFSPPAMPVVSNVTGRPHESAAAMGPAMVRQVTSSVQWVDTVRWFQEQGVAEYVECGPGRVLAGLIKRIDRNAIVHSIQDVSSLKKAVEALKAG